MKAIARFIRCLFIKSGEREFNEMHGLVSLNPPPPIGVDEPMTLENLRNFDG